MRSYAQERVGMTDWQFGCLPVHFKLTNVDVYDAKHAGLYVRGEDVNVGAVIGSSFASNCTEASSLTETLGECANSIDRSFLGIAMFAPHTASARDRVTDERFAGYLTRGNSQRSVYIGDYSESDQLMNQITRNSITIGGLSGWEGFGGWLFGRTMNGLYLRRAGSTWGLMLGEATGPDDLYVLRMENPENGWTYNLRWDTGEGAYRWDVAGLRRAATYIEGTDQPTLGLTTFFANDYHGNP